MSHRLARLLATIFLFTAMPASSTFAQGAVPAGSAKVTLPDTPAGRTVSEWLEAWNSGDSLRLGAYYRKWHMQRSLEMQMARRAETGGFDLVSIEKGEPRYVEFVVKERKSDNTAYGVIELDAGDTTLKQSFLGPIPRGRSVADFKIDAATRARVIDAAIAQLDTNYVFPDVATKMRTAVRAKLKHGDYNNVTNGVTFAMRLTDDFRDVSHDLHLRVNFIPGGIPDRPANAAPDLEAIARMRREMERMNCGFVKTEQLSGNVGYLKFNFFADADMCAPTASAAMNFLANSDALIVDLRENGGGQPAMVAFITSYLFDGRTHLNDLWTRRTNSSEEFWTREVPGKRFGGTRPVYVLTSRNTFSGAEEFTYNLKNLKRATIVGETTGGGAHPVSGHKIDDRFVIGVPFARAINPISKTNWEGTGVEPDVKVPAADALTTAQKLIAERSKP